VKRSITGFIARGLKLKVNEQKRAVARPAERKFLGFSISNAQEGAGIYGPDTGHQYPSE
jgi:RNA-directed DNA polymerase